MDEKSDSFQKKMGEPTVGSSGSMHHYYDRLLLFASSLFMSDLSEYTARSAEVEPPRTWHKVR